MKSPLSSSIFNFSIFLEATHDPWILTLSYPPFMCVYSVSTALQVRACSTTRSLIARSCFNSFGPSMHFTSNGERADSGRNAVNFKRLIEDLCPFDMSVTMSVFKPQCVSGHAKVCVCQFLFVYLVYKVSKVGSSGCMCVCV